MSDSFLFMVGQIVHHLRYDYRGVIIARDSTCQAEDAWYDHQTAGKNYRPTKQQPWYHVLVDGTSDETYVAQQNLEPGDGSRPIDHPLVDRVFPTFLNGRYHERNLN